MRHAGLCTLFVFAALTGCNSASPDGGTPVDLGAPSPDLTPLCLPPEGEPDRKNLDPNCPIIKAVAADTFDELLTNAGLDRCGFSYSAKDWSAFGGPTRRKDPFRLPFFDDAISFPVNAPPFARRFVSRLDAAAASDTPVARAIAAAGSRLGAAPIALCDPPPLLAPTEPLARAISALIEHAGGTPDEAALVEDAGDIPPDLQAALAEVVFGLDRAYSDWRAVVGVLTDEQRGWLYGMSGVMAGQGGTVDFSTNAARDFLAAFDLQRLVEGGARLAAAIERARLVRFAGTRGFSFDQKTPLGRIVIADAADHTYGPGPAESAILLVVDTGGADTYQRAVGAVGGEENPGPLGVAIDLGGKDTYRYEEFPTPLDGKRLPSDIDGRLRPQPNGYGAISLSETPRQGGARLGYGFLFDYGDDDDQYRSLRLSQGFAAAGVGVLYDAGGADSYDGEADVQGAATFGVGLLLDGGAKNDKYHTYTQSQGFGYVRGAGVLYDGGGADSYDADIGDPGVGGDPIYYSPQLPGSGNSSFTQGAGFGRRPPGDTGAGDRVYMSGGLGVLRDRGVEADSYVTSVFGQGTGYWFGTGILADEGGNDRYDGKWYVQASAAHAGLALFLDDDGNDQYNRRFPMSPPAATSIGVGHDFSVSFHIDGGGKDDYRGPGLSIGAGHANGIGVFLNLGGGDDLYDAGGEPTIGAATIGDALGAPQRLPVPSIGLFLDVGGKDTYRAGSSKVVRGDDTKWTNNLQDNAGGTNNRGAGLDTAAGAVQLP